MGNGGGGFGPKTEWPIGAQPWSVAAADLNGDGAPELVTANKVGQTATVLVNDGHGLLAGAGNYTVGSSPTSVVLVDTNWDRKLDMVVANSAGASISLYRGNGDGTFSLPPPPIAVLGVDAYALAVGDFNSDSRQDIAVASLNMRSASVLLGNGDGTFGSSLFSSNSNQSAVNTPALSDLNGDGKLDLAGLLPSAKISVHLGLGNGTFGVNSDYPLTPAGSSQGLVLADLNGDSRKDLIVTNYALNSVSVLLGTSLGAFGSPSNFSTDIGPYGIPAAADLNNDGRLDIATVNSLSTTTHSVSVLLGNGDGTLGNHADFVVGQAPRALVVANFNGDAYADIAVVTSDAVSILLGVGAGAFSAHTEYPAGLNEGSIARGDFNADGRVDLAVGNAGSPGTVSILLGNGNGTFGAPTTFGVGFGNNYVVSADMTGDGKLDLVVSCDGSKSIAVLLGRGDGTFAAKDQFGPTGALSPSTLALGDLNGDGRLDVVVGGPNPIPVLLNLAVITAVADATPGSTRSSGLRVFPNPFNPITNIEFHLDRVSAVRLEIYDVAGRQVCRLLSGAPLGPGIHRMQWLGQDLRGRSASSGVYFLTLKTEHSKEVRRIVLLH